jgi:hypothetical protein
MQISKLLRTGSIAALCLCSLPALAGDTAEDVRLREALRQKMAELGAESTPAAPATPAPTAPKAKATPPPVTQPPPITTAPKTVVAPPTYAQPAPAVTVTASPSFAAPTAADDPQTARIREAMRQRMAEENTHPTVAVQEETTPATTVQGSDQQPAVSTTVVTPAKPTKVVSKPVPPAPTPMTAPPLPIPATKQERLAELLQKYKADQITPEEYHTQRAKILAE